MKRIFQNNNKKSSSMDFDHDDDDNDIHIHNNNNDNDDDAWNPNNSSIMKPSKQQQQQQQQPPPLGDEFGMPSTTRTTTGTATTTRMTLNEGSSSSVPSVPNPMTKTVFATTTITNERPNYRGIGSKQQQQSNNNQKHNNEDEDDDEEEEAMMNRNRLTNHHDDDEEEDDDDDNDEFHHHKAEHIEKSAGTSRLNRILRDAATMSTTTTTTTTTTMMMTNDRTSSSTTNIPTMSSLLYGGNTTTATTTTMEKVSNPRNMDEMCHFVGRVVVPPLRIDPTTTGGHMLDIYPISMQQETLYIGICHTFESTNTTTITTNTTNTTNTTTSTTNTSNATTTTTTNAAAPGTTTSDMIYMSTLQYPNEYSNRKRNLGLFSTTTTTNIGSKYRTSKIRYIMIGRSTNRPLLKVTQQRQVEAIRKRQQEMIQNQYLQEQLRDPNNNNNNNNKSSTQQSSKHSSRNNNNNNNKKKFNNDESDYDTMFAPDDDDNDDDDDNNNNNNDDSANGFNNDNNDDTDYDEEEKDEGEDDTESRDNNNNNNNTDSNNMTQQSSMTNNNNKRLGDRKSVKIAIDDDMDYNETNDTVGGGNNNNNNKKKNTNVLQIEDEEISSFPVLICMTLQNDGTGPDIRKLIPLDQLTTLQDLNSTIVQLAFANGDTIRIDFGNNNNNNETTTIIDTTNDTNPLNATTTERKSGGGGNNNISMERSLDKERFIWSILQIHAMLCMSVVERNSRGTNFLLPLNVRNVDRAELQYIATINGFISNNESIRTLLERQRKLVSETDTSMMMISGPTNHETNNNEGANQPPKPQLQQQLDMDEMAYDLMMGNFATRVTLFHSDDERKDAEEILNSPEWTEMFNLCTLNNNNNNVKGGTDTVVDENGNTSDAVSTLASTSAAMNVAERLTYILQSRMRDLEAETCRRLIAWEDEKHISLSNKAKLHDASDSRDTVDALALASLFKTLESLDSELKAMEDWLQERAAAIKPLTDDCADIEEENRQLEQQWKSYDMLGNEMKRLLHGQELDETTETILKNPASVLVYDEDGLVNIDESEDGIERLYESGKALLDAIEFPRKCGGIHLKAVAERAKGLTSISNTFCGSLAQIIVTVMEQFKTEVVAGSDHGKVSKNDTHTVISKKIRDTQRKFQSALLSYIKLIEILAALAPDMLPALRDAYAELVAEGILMKKRMKGYFQALPGKNTACLNRVGKNIKDYVPFDDTIVEETVNAPDIRAVLSELLPVIAREAYFTSALFGSMNREQDGREKKRNFENAKNAVDKASVHFRYYLNRTCGVVDIITNEPGDAIQKGDPLLSLVATIYLNEIMDSYVDREKKGGDHSLSLAYVRATILDLRKKADKQWVTWIEQQIEWVKSNDGVPITGKRAGVFPSFAKFPVYLDHVMQCCKEGRDDNYFPDLPGIKVINYYLQKIAVTLLESLRDCARRETTDQSYASHVMQMENTYFFTQAVKERGEVISKLFAKQVTKANAICKESTDAYLGWMIKREFTALHELFSRVSKIRKELGDSDVVSHVPKVQFIKTLQKEANRDVLKEKIGTMYSRMEKHLSEEGQLLPIAWKALVKVLYEWFGRWEKLCTTIYKHKLDPSSVDVVRIAKAAGGGVVKSQGTAASEGTTEFGFKSILALGNKQGIKY